MPITAKLSRQFYEKLGDEVTNELVTWLNAVDESYRAEFRDLFGANFGQVRAEMAALRSELRADMALLRSELRGEMDSLRAELRGEMDSLRAEVRGEMVSVHAELAALDHSVEKRLAAQKTELLFWMFLFWIGTVGALLLKTGV
ncbi:MAG: hypothetical protein A2083_05190 [Gemmatimonadetes bacterium GWC2_71_9]|nr:MAG: hypothetical protein A2083_05190 [Gemmatimonadetes bacterium GWC2_71_9]